MKKLIFFMIALLFATALPAETLYYYVEGKKVFLTEDFSSYSFIRTTLTKANFVLPQNVKVIQNHKNISIIEVNDSSAKENLTKNGALFPAYIKEGVKVHVSGQLFVKIPGQPNAENAGKWCKKHGMTLVKQYKYVPEWYLVTVEENPIKKAANLVESKITDAAEPSFFIPIRKRAYTTPNDPLFKNQWHLHNDGSNSKLSGSDHAHVAEAWEVLKAFKGNLGGQGVKLAIVDDGFDLDHEDFQGRFTNGYDFNDNDNDPTYENNNRYPEYSDMHGTCCAGVAGAATDNGTGVSGACPNCTLIPIRMDMMTYSLDSAAIDSFEWAADAGADIISNSWGPEDNGGAVDMNTTLKNLVATLAASGRNGKGIVILFAAGNGNESIDSNKTKDGFANNENVFAIGATKADGVRTSYSDYGKSLDFMAPSSDFADDDYDHDGYYDTLDGIWTIDNTGKDGYNTGKSSLGDKNGNYTNDFGGTSSACPLAAGITGLILSANPALTRNEIYEIYIETSDKVGGVNYSNGFNEKYGYGRINACEAVKKALEMAGKNVSQVVCGGSIVNPDPIEEPDDNDAYCGNGIVEEDEECDDGNTKNGDGCSKYCMWEETPVDSDIDTTDTSDSDTADTGDSDTADSDTGDSDTGDSGTSDTGDSTDSSDTTVPDTGDTSDFTDTEASDSGNSDSGAYCGNNIVEEGEQCDDGNTKNGDGCSKYCMFEKDITPKNGDGCALTLFD